MYTNYFFIFFLFFTGFSYGQTTSYGEAELSAPACVVLNEEEPLFTHYEMDLTVLNFKNEQEAKEWAGYHSNNLITLSVDYGKSKAYAQIHNSRLREKQDITWWNAYLADLCQSKTK